MALQPNGAAAGPVTTEELKRMAAAGELQPDDLIWKAGMAEWAPAGKIKGLLGAAPAATAVAQPVAPAMPAPEASQLGYFSNTSGVTPRTANTLKGYAASTGDRGDWPLDDAQLAAFQTAEKYRKKIRNAAGLYWGLFALCLIAFVVVGLIGLLSRRGAPLSELVTAAAISAGLAVLYYFASKATRKCHRWAPLTLFILFMAAIAFQMYGLVMAMNSPRNVIPAAITAILGMILPAAFASSSWQAFSSIPKYLATPMWCQEALVNAKL